MPGKSSLVKLLISGMLLLTFTSVSYAEYAESDLNNLFTTKKQRAKIDSARYGKRITKPVKHKQKTRKVKVNGYVTRSDGKSVVWLNDKNTMDRSKIGDVKVHQSSIGQNKKVTISVDGKTTSIKPGEVWQKKQVK